MSKHAESDRVLDTVVVAALTGMLLLSFEPTFADRDYLFGAIAGLLTIGAIVLVADYYDKGVGVMLLGALPAYVVVGATVGIRTTDTYFRVPTPESMAKTLSATVGAANQLLTTIPPVDTVGDATLVPYALAFLTGGTALVAALRTERPSLPVVPLVVGLAASILLGTQERTPVQVQVHTAAFAAISLWWVTRRAARRSSVARDDRGRVTRFVGTGLYVALLAVTLTVVLPPGSDDADRVVLRGRIGAGADVTAVATPLTSFRRFTRQPPAVSSTNVFRQRLLRVDGLPRGVPLRFATLDSYDGVTWHADNGTVTDAQDDVFLRIGSEVDAPYPGRDVQVGVQVTQHYLSDWLPLPGQLTAVSFTYLDGRAQRDDIRYNPATTAAVVLGGLDDGDDYSVDAVAAPLALGRRTEAFDTDGPLQPDGAFLDEALEPWRASGLSPMSQVRSLATYLRTNGRYSDGAALSERRYTAGHDAERLGDGFFLAPRIVGDDEQYAAFLALAANRLGVPARVVVGALPGRGRWVRGRDVQAWVEVRVADGSWRAIGTTTFMGARAPRRDDGPREAPGEFLGLDDDPQDQPSSEPGTETQPPQGAADGSGAPGGPEDGPGPTGRLLWISLLALLSWAVPLAKLVRRRFRASWGSPEARIVRGWREVLDQARDLGSPVPAGLGRVEQARLLDLDPGPAHLAQDALFARTGPEASTSTAFWAGVRDQRRVLTRRAGLLRRVWAPWNPVSLLPARRRRRVPLVSRDARPRGPAGRRGRRGSARRAEHAQ